MSGSGPVSEPEPSLVITPESLESKVVTAVPPLESDIGSPVPKEVRVVNPPGVSPPAQPTEINIAASGTQRTRNEEETTAG